jgi:hypothetical protein
MSPVFFGPTTLYTPSCSSQMVVTRMRAAEKAREDGMDRAALGEVARRGLGDVDVECVFERVLRSARQLKKATYAVLGALSVSRTLARLITPAVDVRAGRRIGRPPAGRGELGELIGASFPVAHRHENASLRLR